jgi:oligoribonuclease NrnB/cAMP/cGMP phosphodiesterase (DHH superfamily)
MTPQQRAQRIYNKLVVHIQRYDEYVDDRSKFNTIQCALIAVDELIEATSIKYEYNSDFELKISGKKPLQYWIDVKNEIKKL